MCVEIMDVYVQRYISFHRAYNNFDTFVGDPTGLATMGQPMFFLNQTNPQAE